MFFSTALSVCVVDCGDAADIGDAESAAREESLSNLGRLGSSWLLLGGCMQKSAGPLALSAGGRLVD